MSLTAAIALPPTGSARPIAEVAARGDARAPERRAPFVRSEAVGREGEGDSPALLPRYGFARALLPLHGFFLAAAPAEDEAAPPADIGGRAVYASAAARRRVEIPSGDLLDLSV